MKAIDKKKFGELMAGLQEVYVPEKPISETKIELYFRHFNDVTIQAFTQACNEIMTKKRISTFPLPGEFRDCLEGEKSLEAWLMARNAASNHGHAFSIKFPDPVVHSVIQAMGGWVKFVMIPSDDQLTWVQKEFERLYKLMSQKGEHPDFVQGAYDVENHFIDYSIGKRIAYEKNNNRREMPGLLQ